MDSIHRKNRNHEGPQDGFYIINPLVKGISDERINSGQTNSRCNRQTSLMHRGSKRHFQGKKNWEIPNEPVKSSVWKLSETETRGK